MFSFHCDSLSKQGPHLLDILVLHIGLLFTVQNVQQILVDLPSCGPKSRFYVAIILGRRPAHKQWHRSIKSQQLAWDAFDVTLICFLTADHYIYIDILCTVIAATNFAQQTKRSLLVYWCHAMTPVSVGDRQTDRRQQCSGHWFASCASCFLGMCLALAIAML
jgi:hypothetical protein